jgi:site-specific DNA recombinase
MKTNKPVAAAYIRVSTEKSSQRDSPIHQRMNCEEVAKKLGLDLAHFYEDRSSGTSIMGREDMKTLIKDAKAKLFDVIIFSSLSRFARNTEDALAVRTRLVDVYGIRMIAIDENYDSEKENDTLRFTLYSMMNEKVSNDISISSRRGIRGSAMRGNFTGSKAPFGYRKVTLQNGNDKKKTLEIIEEDAEVVKRIFNLYIRHGMGEKAITNLLNEEGIPSPSGKKWGVTSVQRILQNENYTGYYVFGKYTVRKTLKDEDNPQTRTGLQVQLPKDEWQRSEHRCWEEIIPLDTFREAQKIRRERGGGRRGGAHRIEVNPFVNILKCAHCGANYVSNKSGKTGAKGQVYRYLQCSTRRREGKNGTCPNNLSVPLDRFTEEFMEVVLPQIERAIGGFDLEEKIKKRIDSKKRKRKGDDPAEKLKKLEEKLTENRHYLFSLRKDLRKRDVKPAQFEFEKAEVEKEIEGIERNIRSLQGTLTPIVDDSSDLREKMEKAIEELKNLEASDAKKLNFTLRKIIEKITINEHAQNTVYTPFGEL